MSSASNEHRNQKNDSSTPENQIKARNDVLNNVDASFGLANDDEVFGVVNLNVISEGAMEAPIVGRRGRKASQAASYSDSDESAYSDESEDNFEEDSEDFESDAESEAADEEYYEESESDYDEDRGKGKRSFGSSLKYQPSKIIREPQLPPFLAALTQNMAKSMQDIQNQQKSAQITTDLGSIEQAAGQEGQPKSVLTAAQLQQIARNAVSSLAVPVPSTDKKLPILLPRTPQVTQAIRQNVSQELKESISSMLMNPELRAALIAKLQASKAGSQQSSRPPGFVMNRPPMYAKPGYHPSPAAPVESGTIASRRERRQGPQVDYSSFFKNENNEDLLEEDEEPKSPKVIKYEKQPGAVSKVRKRGRPPKNKNETITETKREKSIYDEQESEVEDFDSVSTSSDEQHGVEKILSFRKINGREEFLVKFHRLSYLHAEWISRDELAMESGGQSRITRFLSKPLSYYHFDDKNPFNPDYLIIDRIVHGWSHPDPDNSRLVVTSYLVKWTSLPLDQATWEKRSTIESLPDGPDAIAQYELIPSPWKKRENALPLGKRPDFSTWTKLTESPTYKNENRLRSYQLEGLNWLVYCWMHKQSCIIADEMGLGKTVQAVSFLDLIYNRFNVRGPFLVVAPLSTLAHWQREFAAWSDLRVLTYHGTITSRDLMFEYEFFYKDAKTDQIIPGLCKFDVVLTTYEMTLSGQHHLRNIIWRLAVFDEAHRLKNKSGKAAEVMQTFQIEHKILLTGTPIQNNLNELFSLLNFLQPHRFFSLEHFLKEYGNLQRSEDVERLQGLLKPLMLRRLKEDVEKSIPVKEETIIEVELTSIQKRYYRAILEKNFGFLAKGSRGNNVPNLMNTMMELRKCCIHPYLIKGAEERIIQESGAEDNVDLQMSSMVQASGKLVLVDKLLKKLREGGHKVLIFSQMTRCLDILADYLRWRNYSFERIDGAIRGEDRQAAIDRFCDPNWDSFVFLLCTKAGGVGINLTAADTVVIFDSDWNPQNDLQAQARCHRIGQTKSVKIYRLVTRNTYEREMFDKAGMKLGLDRAILQKMGPDSMENASGLENLATSTPQLGKEEVEELLKRGAYGVLMEGDEAGVKFMDEDIDSILARRTTVIKHDHSNGEGRSAMDGSIFSKASFAATADDLDIDIDDPNFWEIWAKKMNIDPRQVQSSGISAAVDESRMRRVVRRMKNAMHTSFRQILDYFPVSSDTLTSKKKDEEHGAWRVDERLRLGGLMLRFGLSRLDSILPRFQKRSKNDLVACMKQFLKFCIEKVAEDEPKLKEDAEKLLLSKIEFERYDQKKTARQATKDGDELNPVSAGEFAKSEIPYSGASKAQILEFKSFLRDESKECERFKAILAENAREILIIFQAIEMTKQIVDECLAVGDRALSSLTIPNSAGSGPSEWWGRDDDLALILGCYRHGFGEFQLIKEDSSLSFYHQGDVEMPEDQKMFERLFKLLIVIEKRNRASAKLAMNPISLGRRRAEEEEFQGHENDDEEYVLPSDEKGIRGRGRPKRTKSEPELAGFLKDWSKNDRLEFNKLVYSFGLPKKISETEYDWSNFLATRVPGPDGRIPLEGKGSSQLDEYVEHYLISCKLAAEKPSRRRGRPSKSGKIVDEDGEEVEIFDSEVEEDIIANQVVKRSPASLIEMAPERAKKGLFRIELFSKLRSKPIIQKANVETICAEARRSSGLPRWWDVGVHDVALLRGVDRYGLSRPDLIIKNVAEFKKIYDQVQSGALNYRESRRKATIDDELGVNARDSSSYPVVDDIDVEKIGWPNELIILRRIEHLVEILEMPAKPKKKTKSPKKSSTSPPVTKSSAPTLRSVDTSFPPVKKSIGPKRQKNLSDFGFKRGKT